MKKYLSIALIFFALVGFSQKGKDEGMPEHVKQQLVIKAWSDIYTRDEDKAIQKMNELLNLDPEYTIAHYVLGKAYLALGEQDKALRQYEIFMKKTYDKEVLPEYIDLLASEGKLEEARKIIFERGVNNPEMAFLWLELMVPDKAQYKALQKLIPSLTEVHQDTLLNLLISKQLETPLDPGVYFMPAFEVYNAYQSFKANNDLNLNQEKLGEGYYSLFSAWKAVNSGDISAFKKEVLDLNQIGIHPIIFNDFVQAILEKPEFIKESTFLFNTLFEKDQLTEELLTIWCMDLNPTTDTQLISKLYQKFSTHERINELHIESLAVKQDWTTALNISNEALLTYPYNPNFYYWKAFFLLKLERKTEAKEVLESGIPYLLEENPKYMELYESIK